MGSLPEFRQGTLSFLLRTARTYGDLVHYRMGPQHTYLVNKPDYIREVLVTRSDHFGKGRILQRAKLVIGEGLLTSEGPFHLRQRRLVQPAFHRQRLMGYAEAMTAVAEGVRNSWQAGAVIEVQDEMMRLTLDIIARTMFSKAVSGEAQQIGDAMSVVVGMFETILLPFSEYFRKLPLPHVRRFEKARDLLDATIYRLIDERRQSGEDRGDLLSMLLLAQDEGDGTGMSDQQVRDEALTIFLAGHETTANALTWTLYLLSQHADVAQKLDAEIDSVLQGRLPGFDDLPNLRYTEMVLAESMRLYPPAWAIGRRVMKALTLGDYLIPEDSLLVISPYVLHRDSRYYPDPERFDPERFTAAAKESRPKHTYLPFSSGVRQCIGERFAWMEGVLVLATLLQHHRLEMVPGQRIEPRPLITLRVKHGLKMTVRSR